MNPPNSKTPTPEVITYGQDQYGDMRPRKDGRWVEAAAYRQLEREPTESAALARRVEELEGALKPFAALLEFADVSESDLDDEPFMTAATPVHDVCGVRKTVVSVGDLRRAARALLNSPTP